MLTAGLLSFLLWMIRYDVVITSGGVGPTHDDVTIKAVAKALGQGVSSLSFAILLLLSLSLLWLTSIDGRHHSIYLPISIRSVRMRT